MLPPIFHTAHEFIGLSRVTRSLGSARNVRSRREQWYGGEGRKEKTK